MTQMADIPRGLLLCLVPSVVSFPAALGRQSLCRCAVTYESLMKGFDLVIG